VNLRGLIAAVLVAFACAGCNDEPGAVADDGALQRQGRFGSLRDFVLIERPELGARAALLVDRFEATAADWLQFAASAEGEAVGAGDVRVGPDPALPIAGIDLVQARAFAAWRLGRLPTAAEWQLAAFGDGRSRFPWGSGVDPTRANTGELGLGETTVVGTFESGRKSGVDSPYDLVGNVSEWTESVPWRWFDGQLDAGNSFAACRRRAAGAPALGVHAIAGGLVPTGGIVAAGGATVPRLVLGADFQTPMTELVEVVSGAARRERTGLRVVTTVGELLDRLLTIRGGQPAQNHELVRHLLRRHRRVFASAFAEATTTSRAPGGELATSIAAELAVVESR
jgi:hypothetical protein